MQLYHTHSFDHISIKMVFIYFLYDIILKVITNNIDFNACNNLYDFVILSEKSSINIISLLLYTLFA
jgi:hypothetical protein